MCGRFANNSTREQMRRDYQITTNNDHVEGWEPVYSTAPSQQTAVVLEHAPQEDAAAARQLRLAKWGFHPAWAKDDGPRPINARLETVASKRMFKAAFTAHRLLIPMTGFFEWQAQPDGKQPYLIAGDQPLAAAGLYTREPGEQWKATFTVLTMQAADAAGQIHPRMPVFLPQHLWEEWLTPVKLDPGEQQHLASLATEQALTITATLSATQVNRKINNVRAINRHDPNLLASEDG